MAYFDKSEEPVYITLTMNEKSIPIPLINAKQAKIVARDGMALYINQAQQWVDLGNSRNAILSLGNCEFE
jgi:ABC-type uncharacterized transport system substrate-binding protein